MRPFPTLATVLLVAFSLPSPAAAQSPAASEAHAAVRRAVLDYVEGFYEGDTAKLVRSIRTDVHKLGYHVPRASNEYVAETMPWPKFLSYARGIKARGRPAPADAPKEIVIFDVQDQTASAKLTAFWGTDYLLLGKYDGRWMITQVLWQSPPR